MTMNISGMPGVSPFRFDTTRSIVFEEHAAERVGELARGIVGASCLFVTDPGLKAMGLCEPALKSLAEAGIGITEFTDVEADPSLSTLMSAVEAGRAADVTGVIGLGGGSSLDVAKLSALLLGSGEDLEGAWGVNNASGPRLPLVLVPTTAGTGSEVTPISIITVEDNLKKGVSSRLLLPDLALLDPMLTLGLPPGITAATGVDAMVHAIEAYSSRSANNNPMSRVTACDALRLLGANIETVVTNGRDRPARGAMMLGSMLAGMAFANSPVAAVHALAYPLGGIFHIPHGLSNALVLPHVMRFNLTEAAQDYAAVAPFVFPDIDRSSRAEVIAGAFWLMNFCAA
jgi:alcohol dehydrogenase class IV